MKVSYSPYIPKNVASAVWECHGFYENSVFLLFLNYLLYTTQNKTQKTEVSFHLIRDFCHGVNVEELIILNIRNQRRHLTRNRQFPY